MKTRLAGLSNILFGLCFIFGLYSLTFSESRNESASYLVPLKERAAPIKPIGQSISPQADISHVVVKFSEQAEVRLRGNDLVSMSGMALTGPRQTLRSYTNGRLRRLFESAPEAKLDHQKEVLQFASGYQLADLNNYYRISVDTPAEAEQLVNELNSLDDVEIAYVEPMPEPAGDISPPTPDYQPFQLYRNAAPAGVDADYANTLPGGDGSGVKVIDIEGNWQMTHEDLDKAVGGLIAGQPIEDQSWRDHGTAVIGEMIAGDNGYGVTGICPGADIGMVSIGSISTAEALYAAIDTLQRGDLILIELHSPGPHYDFQVRPDQLGYVCMEYWQANFDAIQYAWAKGIVVIEAGGNGSEDFDDEAIYGQLFDTTYRNSHAIIVGAGYPASSASDRIRHGFSNFGERVNLQGYGSGVYTTGYGGLFDGGGDENQYYTSSFSGTSSASPIVTGAAACLQGYYKATYGTPLTSDMIRTMLVATGSPQLGDTSEHIGPRPDLQAAISSAGPPPSLYTEPIYFDTTLSEGEIATLDMWLHNRSTTERAYFYIYDRDTLSKAVGNWLEVSSQSGFVEPSDSTLIQVIIDASAVSSRVARFKGTLEIIWGYSAGTLNMYLYVPAFLTIPCNDTAYIVTSSEDLEGPTYNWISSRDFGDRVPDESFYSNGGNQFDDGTTGPWPIGFDFPFFDGIYDSVFIGVNGALSFTDEEMNIGGYYSGLTIPGVPFTTFVSPFWNDLVLDPDIHPEAGIYIYRSTPPDTMVVQWYHPGNFNSQDDTLLNFEVVLTSDGNILYQYENVGTTGMEHHALVGISAIECQAHRYSDESELTPNVSAGEAVLFDRRAFSQVQSGDVDSSGVLDITDLIFLVDYMFNDGPPPDPFASGDVDCSGELDVGDLVYLADYMFGSGPEPCWYWIEV